MCEHDLDTIEKLRERNKKLQREWEDHCHVIDWRSRKVTVQDMVKLYEDLERKLSVARAALKELLGYSTGELGGNFHYYRNKAEKAIAEIGKGE